jgi:hypothetical protein
MPTAPHDPPLNPYEAPQTRELVFPVAFERSDQLILRQRQTAELGFLGQTAILFYIVAFIVPVAPWLDRDDAWQWGAGFEIFTVGLRFCLHPVCFSWWANLFFWVAILKWKNARLFTAGFLAFMAVVLASGYFIVMQFDRNWYWPLPYGFWCASMYLLMFGISRAKNRHDELTVEPESLSVKEA